MLKMNDKGFFLIEMMISLAILTMMTGVLIPIMLQLKIEQMVLINRLDSYHYLYNTVQTIDPDYLPYTDTTNINGITVKQEFYLENDLIVGKGVWVNAKEEADEATVYFKPIK
ncbi:prepilin-type N-terminal cleavage/methylation domain-containing protein [Amphibacillus sp. MSJ-3]|uniref:prepilin-type N-terminal cleavage/methylation domain-containing protein n=1 Tax=Amphibacillus sp. MSJ-3 TaxID=2841505 RepID=UPI001C0EF851|nr:prepilin-type N-terminal cleavage/methylation domain-containing protein [Amphibacillus sp. MSJ-3]MBU5594775.1 prepilin-type N-terminal cleavage/methylation domain-containing protein [Amphibacillus sp. MSJ-3]